MIQKDVGKEQAIIILYSRERQRESERERVKRQMREREMKRTKRG